MSRQTDMFPAPVMPDVYRSAWISECQRYRYLLTRRWGDGGIGLFVMLNPSTADANIDDPTIRRCMGFCRRFELGGLAVVNLWAMRATKPADLQRAIRAGLDAVGPENDRVISDAAADSNVRRIFVAWGGGNLALPLSGFAARVRTVYGIIKGSTRLPIECLGTTANGSPRHPLYLPKGAVPRAWEPRA